MIPDSHAIAQATLRLDAILADSTPEAEARARARMPVNVRDQHDAASDTIHATVTRVTGAPPPVQDFPPWLTLLIATEIATWAARAASTCMHSPTPLRPQPVRAAAWHPGLVVCEPCLPLLKPSRRALRCSCCGSDNTTFELITWAISGAFVYGVACCPTCNTDLTGWSNP